MMEYITPPCTAALVYYAEFLRSFMVVSIHAVADTLTFIRMTCHNRKDPNIASNSAEQRKRRRVERRFVKQ
ncbi:hypothetical protein COOONC_25355, partial [Cooperia oncophora]